jgi:hypothetical protein
MIASGIGMAGAIAMFLVGVVSGASMLFFIAVFGYMTCWVQRQQLRMAETADGGEFGYDFSQGYNSLEQSSAARRRKPGYWERRRIRKEIERRERARQEEEQRQVRLDAILAKVRHNGLASLTPAERHFLEEETQRRQASER